MEDVTYIGEHLWLGLLGHALVLLAFVASLFSAWSYYKARSGDATWKRLGSTGYIIHGISVFGVIGLVLFAMVSKWYEYDYVFRTVSDTSSMRYLLAAFWADQEGSFLLWMFWHVILGWIMIAKGGQWTTPTMVTLALIQAWITSMLLGVHIPFVEEDYKIGSNPFILIRDVYQAPIFQSADYLALIEGRGLNPLLQNYWMTIHPPVIFLGFASTSIPFAMAVAGLSTKNFTDLLRPMLRWSLFCGFILGLGILMGGAWAYEALTFGGYWAWDPVENTSLVPWLLVIAGIHTNLIARASGYSIRSTLIFYLMGFLFVVYSTFLTRSGILGDTSVHAFTTMGLEVQLLAFLGFFSALAAIMYFTTYKVIPIKEKEEKVYSREFWMFVGALVLCFSGMLMTASTSLPVYNKIVELFNPDHIPIAIDDPVSHHNRFQIWIGVFMGLLAGGSILLRYLGANWDGYMSRFMKFTFVNVGLATLLTFLLGKTIDITAWQQYAFLFAGVFTIISNSVHIGVFVKGNLKMVGAGLSHIGFGILILGIMYSGLNQETITAASPFDQQDFTEGDGRNTAIVLIEDQPWLSKGYWINYTGDTLEKFTKTYDVEFKQVDGENEIIREFVAHPSILYETDFSKIATTNPGNNRYLSYDVFTKASPPPYLGDIEQAKALDDSLHYLSHLVMPGDVIEEETYTYVAGSPIFNFDFQADRQSEDTTNYDLTVGIPIDITSKRTGQTERYVAGLGLKDALVFQFPVLVNELNIKIKVPEESFAKIFTEEDALVYEDIILKQGESTLWQGYSITLSSFDRSGNYKNYVAQEGDIALAAVLDITSPTGQQSTHNPVFILRNAQQFSIKDHDAATGLHTRFANISPTTEEMTFKVAMDERGESELELLIANDVPRDDLLIVQADIFPGMNLVWLGCLMMLGGLLVSWVYRHRVAR